jgi:hypothetical protein
MIAGDTVKLVRTSQDDAVAIQRLTREAYAKWVPIIGREPKPMTVDYAEAVMLFDICYADKLVPVLAMPEKPIPNGMRAGQIPKSLPVLRAIPATTAVSGAGQLINGASIV